MNKMTLFALASAVLYAIASRAGGTPGNKTQAAADTQTKAVVTAANAFLNSLNSAQRAKVQFPFATQKAAVAAQFKGGMGGRMNFVGEKYGEAVWSNFPVSDVPRPGLSLGSLSEAQRNAALHVLQALLSPAGYQKVVDIMDADQVLSESGTHYASGKSYYTLGIFGTPSATAPWMLQFGGHHLGINAALVGPNVAFTPTLTGTQPAAYTRNSKTVRPLGRENDKAFGLMHAFSAAQRQKAALNYRIDDLVLGPGHDGETLPPEGLPGGEMTEAQQTMLLGLIEEWVGMLNAEYAAPKLAQIRADLSRTHFAWYGSTTNPSPVYFRITGPTLYIEFAHQGAGSGSGVQVGGVNHIHTIYRDPTDSYGRGLAAK